MKNKSIALILLLFFQTAIADCNDSPAGTSAEPNEAIAAMDNCLTNELVRVARTYLLLGLASHDEGRYDEAIANFTRALQIAPTYAAAYANRARSYEKLGQYDAARRDLDHAIEIDTSSMQPYFYRGRVMELTHAYDDAVRDYTAALGLATTPADKSLILYRRALISLETGDSDKARIDLDQAIDNLPTFAGAWLTRARIAAGDGDYEAALRDYTKVIELEPANAQAWYERAGVHRKRHQDYLAVKDYARANELDPSLKAVTNKG
ncbi:MAG: tetratricopeptide repeat protein, partial [Pseudomonadales bacterium]|nr:tetratricopeptide repeat protein [Pseudomonadales bacterium]